MKTIHTTRLIRPNTVTVFRILRTTTLKEQHAANDFVGPFLDEVKRARAVDPAIDAEIVRHFDYVAFIVRLPKHRDPRTAARFAWLDTPAPLPPAA